MLPEIQDLETRIFPPFTSGDRSSLVAFLASRGLAWEEDPDYTVSMLRGSQVVGSGSLSGRIIKGLAVDEALAGEGLAVHILSELEAEAARRGVVRPFIYTSPWNRAMFESLGYRLVGAAPGLAVLLEKGDGIVRWCEDLAALARVAGASPAHAGAEPVDVAAAMPATGSVKPATGSVKPATGAATKPAVAGGKPVSALVMNCNPFTLGHLHLVRTAASRSSRVFLFVVAEEASSFPFEARLRLVREGTAGVPNVTVVPGNEYIVSRATFPTYFLKDRAGEAAGIHARLDVDIFGARIAPAVGATARFIGEEPYSEVTAIYNDTMKQWLPAYGIEVVEIRRLPGRDGRAVSASTVRRAIREGDLPSVRDIVPPSTWEYLVSPEAAPVLARIAATDGRH